jgi:predicted RNA binding protein YcfA (HicA-like mRNA interferase family)
MPPVVRPEDVAKALIKLGFVPVSQKGSHRKYRKGGSTAIIPMHYELRYGTLSGIADQAGVSIEKLLGAIKKKK